MSRLRFVGTIFSPSASSIAHFWQWHLVKMSIFTRTVSKGFSQDFLCLLLGGKFVWGVNGRADLGNGQRPFCWSGKTQKERGEGQRRKESISTEDHPDSLVRGWELVPFFCGGHGITRDPSLDGSTQWWWEEGSGKRKGRDRLSDRKWSDHRLKITFVCVHSKILFSLFPSFSSLVQFFHCKSCLNRVWRYFDLLHAHK